MATFTMELKEVIESLYGTSMDEDDYEQAYESIRYKEITYGKLPVLPEYNSIGLGTYPIFNENYRKILNGKIIDEYYNREIGTETIDNFILILRKKMDQIMPYFNQLYLSTEIPYEALDTMRIHSVGSNEMESADTVEATNVSDTKTKSGARVIGSNFPQTMLAGNGDYASTGNDTNSTSEVDGTVNQNSSANNNSSNNSDTLVTGYQAAAADLINKFRSSFINVDTMVIQEIEDCFMLIFNNGDEYFARESSYGWW